MSHLFEVKDSSRRIIHLSHERWSHIQKHRKMPGNIEKIIETIMHPNHIKSRNNLRGYYRFYKEDKEYLFVSVKYLNGKGFVLTSFFTKKIQ